MEYKRVLDRAHSLAQLEALSESPEAVAAAVEPSLGGPVATARDLETRDELLRTVLADIDAMTSRAMRIRLDHALANDTSIAPPTRTVFASTIVGYANNLQLLAQRARDVAARAGAGHPDDVADRVIDCAESVLGLRDAIHAPLFALVQRVAAGAAPEADRRARDRTLPDAERQRWSAIRRDLEAVAAAPALLCTAPMATRVASLPVQIDEPEAQPEVSFADMIEMD